MCENVSKSISTKKILSEFNFMRDKKNWIEEYRDEVD